MTIDPEERQWRSELIRIQNNVRLVIRIKSELLHLRGMLATGIFWSLFSVASLVFGFNNDYLFPLFLIMGVMVIAASLWFIQKPLKERRALGMTRKQWKEF